MSLIKIQGIVLKHMNLAETDKIITLLTDKLGKVDVVVHGAKSHKSRFMASTQPFCYGEYVLYKGKSMYTLSQSSIIESFQTLLMDFDKLVYGSYMLELIDFLTEKEVKNVSLLALLLKTLTVLTQSDVEGGVLKTVFEFKAISIAGYLPQLKACIHCGNTSQEGYFSLAGGGIVCRNCGKTNRYDYVLDNQMLRELYMLRNIKLEELPSASIEPGFVKTQDLVQNYVSIQCDRHFKSLEMIQEINKNRSDVDGRDNSRKN